MMVAKLSVDALLDAFREMTLLELSEFTKLFEQTFDVTAAMPVAVTADVPVVEEEAEEQAEFDVLLSAVGATKIQVIKAVRALTNLGLKEAKDLVDAVPATVLSGISKDTADKAVDVLEKAGAAVTVK